MYQNVEVRRDHTATLISFGEGLKKRQLVNGIGMTDLSSVLRFMAHLPMAFSRGRSEAVLVNCFGMGTTYRSMLSWGTTGVELVPSEKDACEEPSRGFERITVDPPPPAEALGSSLLYSEEFSRLILADRYFMRKKTTQLASDIFFFTPAEVKI